MVVSHKLQAASHKMQVASQNSILSPNPTSARSQAHYADSRFAARGEKLEWIYFNGRWGIMRTDVRDLGSMRVVMYPTPWLVRGTLRARSVRNPLSNHLPVVTAEERTCLKNKRVINQKDSIREHT